MKEIKELRANFGGGDGRAINRHSVRYYEWEGVGHFAIDRILDTDPKCFEILELLHDPREPVTQPYVPPTLKIDGKRYFGDGLSWRKAESVAKAAIIKVCEEQ